jgi:hypothetical protein
VYKNTTAFSKMLSADFRVLAGILDSECQQAYKIVLPKHVFFSKKKKKNVVVGAIL